MCNNNKIYSPHQQNIWYTLYHTQINLIKFHVHESFLTDLKCLGISDQIPTFDELNQSFSQNTDWELEKVDGLVDRDDFINLLGKKKFPVSINLREEIDFAIEPDLFHDVFGHLPTLLHPEVRSFLFQVSQLSKKTDNQIALSLQRVIWFTIETGILKEGNKYNIYGASILSSPGFLQHIQNGKNVQISELNWQKIINNTYSDIELQNDFYSINCFSELQSFQLI